MPDVWDLATGNPQVIVAVIDTGAAHDLDDFSGTVFVPGRDIVNDDSDPYDDSGHGTHVAATIAESTHNALGAAGMAYGVSLMPVKVLGRDSLGWTSDVVEGIYWAVDHGAAVINLSLGGQGTQSLHDACRYAYQHGVPVVAAAGNGNADVQYPAAYDELVLAVGATRLDRQRTSYSNFGPALDVVAPGGDLSVDQDGDGYFDGILQQTIRGYLPGPRYTDYTPGYFLMQGTSMACAHVSALAALLKTRHPGLTPDEVFSAATGTALDLGSPGRDDYYGHGLIDPLPALALGAASYPIGDSVSGSVVKSGGASGGWRIRTAPGTTVDIELTFSPAEGNLDLFLYDRSGAEVASSTGLTGRETLSYSTLSGGTYLVGVEYVP
jgi:serine protease